MCLPGQRKICKSWHDVLEGELNETTLMSKRSQGTMQLEKGYILQRNTSSTLQPNAISFAPSMLISPIPELLL